MSEVSNQPGAVLEHAKTQLATYLNMYPEERQGLLRLSAQFQDGDPDLLLRSNMQGHITTSSLVVDEAAGKVLMIFHRTLSRWLQPGGHYEGTDPLELSAAREGLEETGIEVLVRHPWHQGADAPFDIDSHPIPANPVKSQGAHWHHDFIYLFAADSTQPLRPQLDEVWEARWMGLAEFQALPGRFARMARKLKLARAHDATSLC